ncbi:MAG: hypothetical protein ACLRQN_25510 [Bacteroides faecis]
MIFFVTQDLEGQPRQLEMHLMPEKEVSMMNQRFTEYLQRQRKCTSRPLSKATCRIFICAATSFRQE